MVEFTSKKGITSEHLKPVEKMSSLPDIVSFADSILPSIINHRNHLCHYRNAIHSFEDNFDVFYLDIDYSENLSIPVKFELQPMHWHKDTITVHSGIVKLHGGKWYHPCLSNGKRHDQTYIKLVLKKMLESVPSMPEMCIIESDNCNVQYKSAQHFEAIHCLSTTFKIPIVQIFSIAGHGKGEVDHVGGLAKCAIR